MEKHNLLKSGEYLVAATDAASIFIPEEFNEEQLMISQTCRDFLTAEVYPAIGQLEKGDRELMKSVLKKSGELSNKRQILKLILTTILILKHI